MYGMSARANPAVSPISFPKVRSPYLTGLSRGQDTGPRLVNCNVSFSKRGPCHGNSGWMQTVRGCSAVRIWSGRFAVGMQKRNDLPTGSALNDARSHTPSVLQVVVQSARARLNLANEHLMKTAELTGPSVQTGLPSSQVVASSRRGAAASK
jgi:hypothetical protein